MLKYNDRTIYVGFIKQLLHNFNLPKMKIIDNNIVNYIKNSSQQNTELSPEDVSKVSFMVENKFYLNRDTLSIWKTSSENGSLNIEEVDNYYLNEEYLNLTKTLNINSLFYDSTTHKYLGDYLRFLRDFRDQNLMSMYNCFGNEVCSNSSLKMSIKVNGEDVVKEFNSSDNTYKLYMVPVKFSEKYSIAIDCHSGIEAVAAIVSSGKVVKLFEKTYKSYNGCIFTNPIVYSELCNKDSFEKRWLYEEDSLYLIVKVPFNCNSAFTVLEGEYTPFGSSHYLCNNKEFNPQLMNFNSGVSYPMADRLIEYLSENVISNTDEISKNISKIQRKLVKHRYLNVIKTPGIWSEELTGALTAYYNDKKLTNNISFNPYDFIGYVDKDVERILGDLEERL